MQFHPYANHFPAIAEGEAYTQMKEDIRERGQLETVKFRVLDNGTEQGLDGRNRLRICGELGIEPRKEQVTLPDYEVEAYIDSLNLHRRHLTRDQQTERRKARIDRIAQARRNGHSTRDIAEQEHVSPSQVRRDIAEAESTAPPGAVEPPKGKVTGKDGKKRDAKPKREPGDDTEQIKADEKANAKAHRENGKPTCSIKQFNDLFGKVARSMHERAKLLKQQKDPAYLKCEKLGNEFLKACADWWKK